MLFVPLHHPAIIETPILDNIPIDVRLAVFLSPGLAQKHDKPNLAAEIQPRK
jgi:hypothetical protein